MIKDKLQSKPQDIAERTFIFSTRALKMTTRLPKNQINTIICNQIIRSATSIGANIEEARGGHTKTDFTYSMNIAKKEAREAFYWLRLIVNVNSNLASRLKLLLQENKEIIKILTSIVKSSKSRIFNNL